MKWSRILCPLEDAAQRGASPLSLKERFTCSSIHVISHLADTHTLKAGAHTCTSPPSSLRWAAQLHGFSCKKIRLMQPVHDYFYCVPTEKVQPRFAVGTTGQDSDGQHHRTTKSLWSDKNPCVIVQRLEAPHLRISFYSLPHAHNGISYEDRAPFPIIAAPVNTRYDPQ